MKVILVDDEIKFITMLVKRLKLRGIDATFVTNGEDAIAKVGQTHYDIGILDIKMPGISGLQLKQKLAELDDQIKFIFVTGHGSIGRKESNCQTDDIFLSKPLDIEILIKTMESIL